MSTSMPRMPGYLPEDEQARRCLAIAIARQASRFVSGVTTSRVKLTQIQLQEGFKGRLVGREGRNVQYFQEKAGVDLLLNDEKDSIVVSCFDVFRREVARVALEMLMRDGRIHFGSIEESLRAARVEVDLTVREKGLAVAQSFEITDLHPAVIRVLGTLSYRNSYGQNQLDHSVESAHLCGSLAAELGYDVGLAQRAALLHDLGKGLDQTHDGGHAAAGAEFAQKYGESPVIVQAIASHHEEVPPQTWLDHLVIAADALSGARPGVRYGSTQASLERAEQMEKIAMEIPGVQKAFAVQAGRELRVFVDHQKISDSEVPVLARQVTQRIREEVRFPGQIQVVVQREMRAVEVVSR